MSKCWLLFRTLDEFSRVLHLLLSGAEVSRLKHSGHMVPAFFLYRPKAQHFLTSFLKVVGRRRKRGRERRKDKKKEKKWKRGEGRIALYHRD